MSINQRIKFLVDDLAGGNVSRFAKEIGVSHTTVNTILPGEKPSKPGYDTLVKIIERFPSIDTDWLLKGEGNPKDENYKEEHENTKHTVQVFTNGNEKKHELQAIPLYDITASAGLSALYNSSNNILDYLSIPNLPRCDGAINVKGDSMYPLLKHGDIVVFQRLNDILEEIDFGEMYVVDMSTPNLERIYVKYVKKSDKGDEYVTLHSYNEKHHPPKDVKLTKIRAMAAVKASIRLA